LRDVVETVGVPPTSLPVVLHSAHNRRYVKSLSHVYVYS
jgi:hypothetical protein